jgi:uncharacterized membrane protein
MARLKQFWNGLLSSLWFVPTVIVLGAVFLAVGLIQVDSLMTWELAGRWPRLFGAGAEGSRGMLSAIASSMITVAGVIFSITIVTLSLASSQYSPRILRNFMRDRANQVVLGVFVGVFTYCLIVLRTIRGDEDGFVPQLSVFFSLLLALVAVGFLIFFIHHTAAAIQSSSIIASAAHQTMQAVDHLFPQELGHGEPEDDAQEAEAALAAATWQPVPAQVTGYIQSVDPETLFHFAGKHDLLLRMEKSIGDFVVEGALLASVTTQPDEAIIDDLNELYTINRNRTLEQDAAFGLRQIVDIALKALSPGINDTTTAVICVDYLSAILARLARRRLETPYRWKAGQLKLIAKGPTFEGLVDIAFNQIRQNAGGNVSVIIRMLSAIETVATQTETAHRRQILLKHVNLIAGLAEDSIPTLHDKAIITMYLLRVKRALEAEP